MAEEPQPLFDDNWLEATNRFLETTVVQSIEAAWAWFVSARSVVDVWRRAVAVCVLLALTYILRVVIVLCVPFIVFMYLASRRQAEDLWSWRFLLNLIATAGFSLVGLSLLCSDSSNIPAADPQEKTDSAAAATQPISKSERPVYSLEVIGSVWVAALFGFYLGSFWEENQVNDNANGAGMHNANTITTHAPTDSVRLSVDISVSNRTGHSTTIQRFLDETRRAREEYAANNAMIGPIAEDGPDTTAAAAPSPATSSYQ